MTQDMKNTTSIRPGRWGYWAGIILFFGGCVWAVTFFAGQLRGMKSTYTRARIPGSHEIRFERPGSFTIFYEYQSVIDNEVYSTGEELPHGLRLALVDKKTASLVTLHPVVTDSMYSLGTRKGRAVWRCTIMHPGDYVLTGWYENGIEGEERVFTIDHGFSRKLAAMILGTLAILALSLCASMAILIVTFVCRDSAKRKLQPSIEPVEITAHEASEQQQYTAGMLCHLTALTVFLGIPLGNILGPLIVWLIKKNESAYVDAQGKESLNFQISMTIYQTVSVILVFVFIGIPLLIGLFLAELILVIIASVRASNGEYYRYPCTIRFLK